MGDLMPDTKQPVADPHGILAWASAMRDAGDLAPMLIVVRDSAVIASGFVDPPDWGRSMGIALYGFEADACVGVMDSWIIFADPDDPLPPDRTPQDAFEAGDPNAAEALQLLWIPRAGATVALCRRYATIDDGIAWDEPAEYEQIEWPLNADAIQKAVRLFGSSYPDDEFAEFSPGVRDASTAKYLGLELR
jgi:hypothetical protein